MTAAVPDVERWAAFTDDAKGGNPAGVVLDARGLDDAAMQRIASDVGYSETAFLVPTGQARWQVRYFTPRVEVPFCGHATIAAGVALGVRGQPGEHVFATPAGAVEVEVSVATPMSPASATLTSVRPRVAALESGALAELLAALRWTSADLDPQLPLRVAFAGAWHPVLAARTMERLADLDYDSERLTAVMQAHDWATVQLVHRVADLEYVVRNPAPAVGIPEDPATGAAAAAFGAYLNELGLVEPPVRVLVRQGERMGRPSRILVDLVPGDPRVRVTGTAVPL